MLVSVVSSRLESTLGSKISLWLESMVPSMLVSVLGSKRSSSLVLGWR